MNLFGPVPWLKLLAVVTFFAMGLYVGAHWVQGRRDAATVAQERDYQNKLDAAAKESKRLQGVADAAQTDRDRYKADLATYLSDHPLSVYLCTRKASPVPHSPAVESAGGQVPAVLPAEAPRDLGPDLDALMAEAQVVNENYRVCRAGYLAVAQRP